MPDWRDDELDDDWAERPVPPGEGVRIVGPGPEGAPPPRAPAGPPSRPAGRFPLPDDVGGAAPREDRRPRSPDSGSVRLPHWTDPPTGEVPRLRGSETTDDDLDSWSSLSGSSRNRFRTDSSDWNVGDFAEGELDHDDGTMVGALADHDENEQAWQTPSRGGGRRGRRGRGPAPDAAGHPPGGLEGPPTYEPIDSREETSTADLNRRVVTGVIMAVVALAAFAAGRPVAAFLVTIVVGVCAFELFDAFRRAGYHTAVVMGLLGCVAIVPIVYNEGIAAIPMVSVLVVTFSFLWYLFEVVHQRPTVNVALTMLVFGYIGILGGYAGLLLGAPKVGTGLLGGVIICAIGSDVVAYFAGRSFGNTPLMPRISPHKTVEGLIAGAIAAVVLGAIVGGVLHPWATWGIGAGIGLGLVVAVTAPLGDLVESMIKRDLHIKDLGGFLPGHGGFLDRFDAMLFALPAAYYLALYLATH